jgi:hypothetical protein
MGDFDGARGSGQKNKQIKRYGCSKKMEGVWHFDMGYVKKNEKADGSLKRDLGPVEGMKYELW